MRYLEKKVVTGFMMGTVIALLSAGAWAEQSKETKDLVAEHRSAAADAQKKVVFHKEMAKHFVEGRSNTKMDMVGHCTYWADYYQKLAAKEEQAAQELENK